jgi:hypothetical protein
MASKIPRDVHEAFRQVVYDFGVEKLASMMAMPTGTLYNKANLNGTEHHKPTLADCIVATHLTGDKRIVQAFAHAVGGAYYDLPDLSLLTTDALMLHLMQVQQENGHFHAEIKRALENDAQIDQSEFARIEREALHFVSAILESVQRMREMAK